MGIFGTSQTEEEALRAAATSKTSIDQSSSLYGTASSAYETASEFENGDELFHPHEDTTIADAESSATIQNTSHEIHDVPKDCSSDSDNEHKVMPLPNIARTSNDFLVMSENELNRIATSNTENALSLERSVTRSRTHGQYIDPKDLDWDGPDDKANPFNWPKKKKWAITATTAIVCLCISLGSSLYVEGVEELEVKFHISRTLGLSGLTFYLIGLAFGPVIAAPLSEMIGRRWIYITTFPISMLFTMGVGLSQNIRSILVLRFFSGFLASPPMSLAGGTIADMWGNLPEEMSVSMAYFCVAPFLGPVLGPVIGGFAAEHKGWRWTMWVSLMFSGAILPFLLACPETFKLAILTKRAKKRGIKLIEPNLDWAYVKYAASSYLIRPVEMLFVEPIVGLTSIYIAFVFAVLFGFFEAFPIIFRGVYGMDTGVSGLAFLSLGVGLIIGVAVYIVVLKVKTFPKNPDGTRGRRDEKGAPVWDPPESKLAVAQVGAVFLPIALFWLAWTAKPSVHWIAPALAGIPFGFGLIWVFFGVILYYTMSFPPAYMASALAANNLLRYFMASVFPLFIIQMYEKLHIDWATSLLAFISLAMIPIPFVFSKYGSKLRQNSKYGYAAYFRNLAAQKAAAEAEQRKESILEDVVVEEPNQQESTESPHEDVAEKV